MESSLSSFTHPVAAYVNRQKNKIIDKWLPTTTDEKNESGISFYPIYHRYSANRPKWQVNSRSVLQALLYSRAWKEARLKETENRNIMFNSYKPAFIYQRCASPPKV